MTDYSKCSVRELQEEIRLAEARIRREQQYIGGLKEIIEKRVDAVAQSHGMMIHTGCIADS